MQYSATVPQYVMNQLPDLMQTGYNKELFAAAYRQVCGMAYMDMHDVDMGDNTYYNMALYAAANILHDTTGQPEYFNLMHSMEDIAMDAAMVEGIDLEQVAASRMYYVPAQVFAAAASVGYMPDSKPIELPYCNTYQEAMSLMSATPKQSLPLSARYGQGDLMPTTPPVNVIYTVWATPERIDMLKTPEEEMINAFPRGVINPKTVIAVDCLAATDALHAHKHMHEDVPYDGRPTHDAVRREMDLRVNAMCAFQSALGKTPAVARELVDMYGADHKAFCMCFSKDGFVSESPFDKTMAERVMQLTLRELRNLCCAETLSHTTEMVADYLKEFNQDDHSLTQMAEGLQQRIENLGKQAVGDKEYVASVAASAQNIVTIIAHERAEMLMNLQHPLTQEQRDFLKAAAPLVPEQLRNEFILRTAHQMQHGMSSEAAVRLASRAMAKEAQQGGSDVFAGKLNNAAENAGLQYAMYQTVMAHDEEEIVD